MIDFILGGAWQWIAGFAGIVAAFFAVRQSGKKSAQNKRTAERLDGLKNKQEVTKDVQSKPDSKLISGIVQRKRR